MNCIPELTRKLMAAARVAVERKEQDRRDAEEAARIRAEALAEQEAALKASIEAPHA